MSGTVRNERGFVLSMVIVAVAALSIAGTALFLVVQSENAMANAGAESSVALHLANAGLARYMGEHFGAPEDTVVYEMGGGVVTVSAGLVVPLGDTAAIYVVRSEARILDRRVSGLETRRAVQQFARLRKRPFQPVAALAVASSEVSSNNSVVISGVDACGVGDVAGIGTTGARANRLNGTISSHVAYASRDAMLDAIGLDWELLTDSLTPVEYQDEWPSPFPADSSFPTIRFSDDVDVTSWTPSGRGLLIVDGTLTLSNTTSAWEWDGVILAGSIDIRNNARADIDGTLLTGFEGTQGNVDSNGLKYLRIQYNSCHVLAASSGIALFSPVPNTWWESAD